MLIVNAVTMDWMQGMLKYFHKFPDCPDQCIYSSYFASALENGSGGSGMNNPFSVMPGLAGLMGMGGMGSGLNNSQITNMWGGMGGPRNMPPMGYNRGMMEQVTNFLSDSQNTKTPGTFQLGLAPSAPFSRAREQVLSLSLLLPHPYHP